MIQFKELRITADKKFLIVEANIIQSKYYDDVYISKITVDTQKSFTGTMTPEMGPSTTPLCDPVIYENKPQEVRAVFDIDSISDNLFFVFVEAEGEPAADAPCGIKDKMIVGVAYDKELIYNKSMKLIGNIDGCTMPREFINFALQLDAFELCLHTGNYMKAIEFWKKFFHTEDSTETISSNCLCNGKV